MTMSEKDGGPAFGSITSVREVADQSAVMQMMQDCVSSSGFPGPIPTVTQISTTGGMSLRAYIATAVLQGMIASGHLSMDHEGIAERATNLADALLAELSKP